MPSRRFALPPLIASAALAAAFLVPAVSVRAEDASAATPEETKKLVEQLGDPAYAKREEAATKLRAIGKPAQAALREAAGNDDPEVATRAQALLRRIERRPVPAPDPHAFAGRSRLQRRVVGGEDVLEITERGREVRISQGTDGVRMSVTGLVDGKPGTEEYAADSVEQLKEDNPEAFALFERYAGRIGGDVLMLNGRVWVNGGMIVPPAVPDEIEQLRARLDKQMRDGKLKEAQREEVNQAIDKLADARVKFAGGAMDKYSEQCDELRKVLEQNKLDPGDLLPPPAKTRLGVSIAADDGDLVIRTVADNSRAQRIGLQPGDAIRKVGGKDVDTVGDLRTAVSAKETGLVVEITRDGQDMKLEEKQR